MDVFFAAGVAAAGGELVEGLGSDVEEIHKRKQALRGVVGGVAELFYFGVGERGLVSLSMGAAACGGNRQQEEQES